VAVTGDFHGLAKILFLPFAMYNLTERYLGLVVGGTAGGLLEITRIHRADVLKELDSACSIHH
jgi:hypothetical protein